MFFIVFTFAKGVKCKPRYIRVMRNIKEFWVLEKISPHRGINVILGLALSRKEHFWPY